MTTWPTAATSEVAPGRSPGQQLGDAERGGDGDDRPPPRPASRDGCVADVRVVLVEVPVAVLTGASSRFGVTFACRGSSARGGRRAVMRAQARPSRHSTVIGRS